MINTGTMVNQMTSEAVSKLFQRGLIRSQPILNQRRLFSSKQYIKLAKIWMLLTLHQKYSGNVVVDTARVNIQLAECYMGFLLKPAYKNNVINAVFVLGYLIHETIFHKLPQYSEHHDARFVFDIYKFLSKSITGSVVSTQFIKRQVKLIFTKQFLDYLDNRITVKQYTPSPHYFGTQIVKISMNAQTAKLKNALDLLKPVLQHKKIAEVNDQPCLSHVKFGSKMIQNYSKNQISPLMAYKLKKGQSLPTTKLMEVAKPPYQPNRVFFQKPNEIETKQQEHQIKYTKQMKKQRLIQRISLEYKRNRDQFQYVEPEQSSQYQQDSMHCVVPTDKILSEKKLGTFHKFAASCNNLNSLDLQLLQKSQTTYSIHDPQPDIPTKNPFYSSNIRRAASHNKLVFLKKIKPSELYAKQIKQIQQISRDAKQKAYQFKFKLK